MCCLLEIVGELVFRILFEVLAHAYPVLFWVLVIALLFGIYWYI